MGWLGSDLTGWGAFVALGLTVLTGLLSGRIMPRRNHDQDLREAAEALQRALASKDELIAFYKEAHKTEQARNDVLSGGLLTMVTETRNAVLSQNRAT